MQPVLLDLVPNIGRQVAPGNLKPEFEITRTTAHTPRGGGVLTQAAVGGPRDQVADRALPSLRASDVLEDLSAEELEFLSNGGGDEERFVRVPDITQEFWSENGRILLVNKPVPTGNLVTIFSA